MAKNFTINPETPWERIYLPSLKVTVTHQGKTWRKAERLVRESMKKINNNLEKEAIAIEEHIGKFLNRKRKRIRDPRKPSLASAFTLKVNRTGDTFTVGVGDINNLNNNFRYWRVINNGGYVPPANLGYFSDGAPINGGSGKLWTHTGQKGKGNFFMKPKKPIEGKHYLEEAKAWYTPRWERFVMKAHGIIEKSNRHFGEMNISAKKLV